MSFCPKCGRQRRVDVRFCGGCGNDFGQTAAGGGTASPAEPAEPATFEPPAEPTRWDAPAEPTRWDAPAGQTRLDSPPGAVRPDRYASWFAEPSAAGEANPLRDEPAGEWEAADTVYAKPAQATAHTPTYAPPSQPAPGYPPPAPAGPGRRSGGRGTAILVILVILVVLGAGGGAYALTRSHGRTTAQPPSNPTVTAQASTAAPAVQAPASPVVNASGSPTASPSASATPSPARTGTVQVAPGVTSDPAEPGVEAYLNRYFNSINTHDYSEYNSLLDAQGQQSDSRSSFDSGYATTKDSNEVLTGIEDTGGGSLTANVSFTSHQSPADSIDDSACDNWQISLYLVPQGNSYVATAVPPGYHAAHTAC
jgi:hypothetical protein